MMKTILAITTLLTIVLPLLVTTDTIKISHATGGGDAIAKSIIPNVERAIQALENGDVEKAQYELDEISKQLQDQFNLEEYEKENESK